jgi:uncharacterized C2H2 Zn-finger protein
MATQTAPAQYEQTADGQFKCPECENTYSRERAVRRHLTEKHGWPVSEKTARKRQEPAELAKGLTKADELPTEDTVSFQVRAELRELALPLREKMQTIERRLVEMTREMQDLREAKNQIERTLRGLEGTPAKVQSNAGQGHEANYRKKVMAVERYVTTTLPPQLQEGFTATALAEAMKTDGVTPVLSAQVAARAIGELRDRGILRLDRISKGGGASYLVTQSRNGKGVTPHGTPEAD